MKVTLHVPEDHGLLLGKDAGSLTQAALEALALEGVRSGKLTVAQARRLLGVQSRYEMDGFLKAHGGLPGGGGAINGEAFWDANFKPLPRRAR